MMTFKSSIYKRRLSVLGLSTSLIAIVLMQHAQPAHAACDTTGPGMVECSTSIIGIDNGFRNGAFTGTVDVLNGTETFNGNDGVIRVGNGAEVDVSATATLLNSANSGNSAGIRAGNDATINTAGRIHVRRNGIVTGTDAKIANSGEIVAGLDGIVTGTGANIENTGDITAGRYGFFVSAGTTITNSGTVISNHHIVNATNDDGVTVINEGTMRNRTSVKGVWLYTNATVMNGDSSNNAALPEAWIAGGDDGVLVRDNSTIINYANGRITGGAPLNGGNPGNEADGVDVHGNLAGGQTMITNYGIIETLDNDSEAIEVSTFAADYETIIHNYGTVQGIERGIWEQQQGQEHLTRGIQRITNYDGGVIRVTAPGGFALKLGDGNDSYEIHGGSTTIGIADGGRNENFGGNDNDQLILGGATDGNFDADELSGNFGLTLYRQWEEVIKNGTSTWTLTGTNSPFDGIFEVREGTLVNNAVLDNATIKVNGGTLTGNGSSGGISVSANGIFNPGTVGGIGTYTVNNDLFITNTGVFEVDLDETGAGDQVIVNGLVGITGSTLAINELPGNWLNDQTYLLIDNDGVDAVIGTFGTITNQLVFLDPTVDYMAGDGNDVALTLTRNDTEFADVAKSKNQGEAADGLTEIFNGLPNEYQIEILGMSNEEATEFYDQLSGEVHAAVSSTLLNQNGRVFNTIGERIAMTWVMTGNTQSSVAPSNLLGFKGEDTPVTPSPIDEPASNTWSFWAQASGEWRTIDSDGNGAEQDMAAHDLLIGIDITNEDQLTFGVVGGYSHTTLELDDVNSTATVNTGRSGVYVAYLQPNWQASAIASYAFHNVETHRDIPIGIINLTKEADYHAHELALQGKVGYTGQVSGLFFHPSVGLSYTWLHRDGYSETGAAPFFSLVADSQTTYSLKSSIGIKVAREIERETMVLLPELEVQWHHEFGDVNGSTIHTFEGGGTPMFIEGAKPSRDTAEVSVGLQARFNNGVATYLNASTTMSEDELAYGGRGGMRFLF